MPLIPLPWGRFERTKVQNQKLLLHGYDEDADIDDSLHVYGADRQKIISMGKPDNNDSLSDKFYISKNLILWAVEHEMAIHIEDVLARRVRCLFLDAKETLRIAAEVAEITATALQKDDEWIAQEIKKFKTITQNYII